MTRRTTEEFGEMTKRNRTGFNPTLIGTLAAVALGGFAVPTARADHEDYPKPRVKIDFESLKGELRWSRGEWQLRIKYDVEIEKYDRGDRFELVLYVSEHGEAVRDDEGKPIEWVVPLDRQPDVTGCLPICPCPPLVHDDEDHRIVVPAKR